MKNIIESINQILAEWNPLDVEENVTLDEYQGFIPQIIKHIGNKEDLTNCLENILINDLEVGYNSKDEMHKIALVNIVEKILQLKIK